MSVTPYIPGEIRLFGAGAPPSADISTPCVRAGRDITSVSFHETSATTYGINSGDTGPARSANHEPVKLLTIGLCMGEKAWVKLANGTAALCRIESAPEAMARADAAIELSRMKLALAEATSASILSDARRLVGEVRAEVRGLFGQRAAASEAPGAPAAPSTGSGVAPTPGHQVTSELIHRATQELEFATKELEGIREGVAKAIALLDDGRARRILIDLFPVKRSPRG